jgi:hypothetical protein
MEMPRSSSTPSELWVLRLAVCLIALVASAASVSAQDINEKPVNCATGLVTQDFVVNHVVEDKSNGILIVVVHPGTGETSQRLRQRRLYNVRQYFKNRGARVPSARVIVAEGEKVTGLGRIDYYFDGKLFAQLVFPKRGYICHSCCGPDEDYYPDKAGWR